MINRSPSMEDSLKCELCSWLSCALDNAVALSRASTSHDCERSEIERVIRGTREMIDAVCLYAAECAEVAETHQLSPRTLNLARFATQICLQLEKEVSCVESDLMNYVV